MSPRFERRPPGRAADPVRADVGRRPPEPVHPHPRQGLRLGPVPARLPRKSDRRR